VAAFGGSFFIDLFGFVFYMLELLSIGERRGEPQAAEKQF
jgi:hypothetical protein